MPSTELYTIIVSGEKFTFTKDQLESDPGNYFATYFFGGFEEAAQGTNELTMEREPMLFRLIQAHLRGYDILPLPNSAVPSYMTTAIAVNNLLKDAQFFNLDLLCQKIQDYLNPRAHTGIQKSSKLYKFACFHKTSGWSLLEITEASFQSHLHNLLKPTNNFEPYIPTTLACPPGYRIYIAWIAEGVSRALLEPNDSL